MSSDLASTRERVRAALLQVLPFAATATVAPVVALIATSVMHPWALVVSFALMTAITLTVVGALTWGWPRWLHDSAVLASFAPLALIVYAAGGASSGLGVVLLAPVVWISLYGRGRAVALALAMQALAVAAVGMSTGNRLGIVDLLRGVVFLALSVLTAWTVSRLVNRLSASERFAQQSSRVLAEVAAATREIRQGLDVRATVCQAVRAVSDASVVLLLEQDGDDLVVTASDGLPLPEVRIPGSARSAATLAFTSGQPLFIGETIGDPRVHEGMARITGARSVLVQPFQHGAMTQGVVVAAWSAPQLQAQATTQDAVSLLAEEIGLALERADLMAGLQARATTDPLTGLANRRVWRDRLPDLLRTGSPTFVALLDLDHFKAYNDTRGHLAGDALLRALASAWSQLLRPGDLLVRWGGEEFALALGGCTHDQAQEIIERMRAAVPGRQTVSAGVARWDGSESIESLMSRADAALYRAKAGGRDRAVSAEPPVRHVSPARTTAPLGVR